MALGVVSFSFLNRKKINIQKFALYEITNKPKYIQKYMFVDKDHNNFLTQFLFCCYNEESNLYLYG